MNVICKNIPMDMVRCKANTQITLDGDINLSENMPDLEKIIFKKAALDLEEEKPLDDHVFVSGKMNVIMLYETEDEEEKLARLIGQIPFEENVFVEGVDMTDHVDVSYRLEDVSISVINSRKVSIRSIVTLCLQVDSRSDQEVAVEAVQADGIEYRSCPLELTQLAVNQRDLLRLHQEISIPGGHPNIFREIFHSENLTGVEFKPLEDKLLVTGELGVFFLYENEQEDDNISFYETVIPFRTQMDCIGCREDMISDITWEMSNGLFEVKPDMDGELRTLSMDVAMHLHIKLYQENTVQLLCDMYGTKSEIEPSLTKGNFRKLLLKNSVKHRMKESIEIAKQMQILQLLHSEATTQIEDINVLDGGASVSGIVSINVLFVTSDDKKPYACLTKDIPFEVYLEGDEIKKDAESFLRISLSQLTLSMADTAHLDAMILLEITGLFFQSFTCEMITKVEEKPLNQAAWKELPMLTVHVVAPGDSLWKIGKQHYMTVEQIKQLNGLTKDEIRPGQKIIVLKERKV